MSTGVASPYLFSTSTTGNVQAEGWSNGAVLLDVQFAVTLGQGLGLGVTPPVITQLSIPAAGGLVILPVGAGVYARFVIPFEHREATVRVHFDDGVGGTVDAELPGSRLVMLCLGWHGEADYTAKFVSITHDDFPLQSLMFVNVSRVTIGQSAPNPSTGTVANSLLMWNDYAGEDDLDLTIAPDEVLIYQNDIPWELPRDEPPPLTLPPVDGVRQNTRYFMRLIISGSDRGITDTVAILLGAGRVVVMITEHPGYVYTNPSYPDFGQVAPFYASRTLQIGTAGGAWNAANHFAREYMAPWLGEG